MNEKKEPQANKMGPTPETLHKRNIAIRLLSGVFLLIALIWSIHWLFWGRFRLYTDDAYVIGNMVSLMPQVTGTVIEINTDETQLVTEGQTLIQLDSTDYVIALAQAKANLAQTIRQVRQYFENAAQAQQKVILEKANLLEAQLNLKRRQGLVGNRAVSREDMQHYKTAVEIAQASYTLSLHQLEAALSLVQNTHLYAHPLVETAKANLKMAYLNLQRTTIKAPVTGYVAKRSVQLGQQIKPSSVLLAIIPLNNTWVDANYKESSLEKMRINQPVTLYADAYPGVTYHGRVEGLNAGTGSAFALLPPQNATGNWIKIVQRLPVRIRLEPDELKKTPLQLGLSMHVTVDIHNLQGDRMPAVSGPTLHYQTNIYQQQLTDAGRLIDDILHHNSKDLFLPKAVS